MNSIESIDQAERTRIDKCLAIAFASNPSDAEIMSGVKSARRLVSKHGMNLFEYYKASAERGSSANNIAQLSSDILRATDLEREVDRLKRKVADAETREKRLKEENDILGRQRQTVTSEHKAVDGFYTYDAFYSALISHLGSPKRALSMFTELTPFSSGKVQAWRRNNKVPQEAFEAVAKLEREQATRHFHQPLTREQRLRIDRLSIEGKTDQQIADIMNIEFDRTFNVNMIKGAKTQIRAAYMADLAFDKTREEAKAAFLARYPASRSIDAMLDKAFSGK
jgi:hypothetical protein